MASSQAPTATEYIVHHLTHLSTAKQKVIIDFSVINYDTVFFSVFLAVVFLVLFGLVARRATAGVSATRRSNAPFSRMTPKFTVFSYSQFDALH